VTRAVLVAPALLIPRAPKLRRPQPPPVSVLPLRSGVSESLDAPDDRPNAARRQVILGPRPPSVSLRGLSDKG